jgi:hypothetical protein
LAFGENLSIFSTYTICVVLRVVNLAYAWCHCEALVTLKSSLTLHSASVWVGVASL